MGTKTTLLTLVAGGLALAGAATLMGHVDDPKEQDAEPRYEGPGYRKAIDGPLLAGEFPQENVELLSWITIGEFQTGAGSANDCWGYTAPSGREYAIICLSNATGFVEITNPADPTIVGTVSAPGCTWHDVKVFEDHAYVVSECGSGIQVIDMSDIDNGNVTHVRNVTTGGPDSHNIAIDPVSGYAYRTGGSGNGLLIYDLNGSRKSNPVLIAQWPDRYVHDAQVHTFAEGPYAGRQIAFCNSGFNGGGTETGLDILDVTDKDNIIQMDRYVYSGGAYSHQGWLSDDGNYFFVNDEADEQQFGVNTTTHIIDVSDLNNVAKVGTFSSGVPSIDHNLYQRDGLIFEANYRSGLRVFDASDPLNPQQIGFFDTYPTNDNPSFNGMWSCYPFFSNGKVIGSDTSRGLFVMSIRTRQIGFEFPDGRPDLFDPAGQTIDVSVFELVKGGMEPGTAMFHYDTGDGFVSEALEDLGGDLYRASFPAVPCGTEVAYYFSAEASDGIDETSPSGAPSASYDALAAADIVIAFADDMESDPGYEVVNENLEDGAWDRGLPLGGGDRGDPAADFDGSGAAWLTDRADGNTDVDGGPTRLITPTIDLSGVADPVMSYARWFYNDDNDQDRMVVEISNNDGNSWSLLENLSNQGQQWHVFEFRVADVIAPTATMKLRFSVDDNPNDSLTEAGLDALTVKSIVCAPPLVGDIDLDGDVDFGDLVLLLAAWGECDVEEPCPADLDENGFVDFNDLLLLIANWTG